MGVGHVSFHMERDSYFEDDLMGTKVVGGVTVSFSFTMNRLQRKNWHLHTHMTISLGRMQSVPIRALILVLFLLKTKCYPIKIVK